MARALTTRSLAVLAGPSLLAATNVLGMYGFASAHWTWVLRPLAVSVAGSLVVTLVALLIIRRPAPAAFAAMGAVAVVLGGMAAAIAVAGCGAWIIGAYWRRIHRRPILRPSATTAVKVPAFALSVTVVSLAVGGAVSFDDFATASHGPLVDQGRPNIYVLLLDGYPRADTLEKTFEYSNDEFLENLSELGFEVAEDSRSSFHRTEMSLLSMLSNGHVPDGGLSLRTTRTMLAQAPMLAQMRDAGYRLAYVPSPVVHTNLHGWDETLDSGHLSELEIILIQKSMLAPLLGEWVADQVRERQEAALEVLVQHSERTDQHVTFVHLLSPHPPFLYGRDGDHLPPSVCWFTGECFMFDVVMENVRLDRSTYTDLFVDQLAYINGRVLEAVSTVVKQDPTALVVVLSDHGARHSLSDTDEWTQTFFAARMPDGPAPLRGDPGPDLLFARLLAATER